MVTGWFRDKQVAPLFLAEWLQLASSCYSAVLFTAEVN